MICLLDGSWFFLVFRFSGCLVSLRGVGDKYTESVEE